MGDTIVEPPGYQLESSDRVCLIFNFTKLMICWGLVTKIPSKNAILTRPEYFESLNSIVETFHENNVVAWSGDA
jgi:hypothetical protein